MNAGEIGNFKLYSNSLGFFLLIKEIGSGIDEIKL